MFLTALALATAPIHVTHPPDDSDAWFVYDSRQRPGKKGNRTADRLGETTYLHDPQRVFNPCIRWFVHTRAVNFECHLQWDEKRCAFCPPVFQWGVGQYTRCNHREENTVAE